MKRLGLAALLFLVAGGLAWLAWRRSAQGPEAEAGPETVVAVRVGTVSRATLRGYVTAYGEVAPEPPGPRNAAGARVAPSVPGVITSIHCAEGQRVRAGDLLFQLDSRAADVAADRAREMVRFADSVRQREAALLEVDGTSRKRLQEAEQAVATARADLAAAETAQALLQVHAPLSGTVAGIHVRPGQAVDLGTVLADLVDLDRLVVQAEVPTAELAGLAPGQRCEVTADRSAPPSAGTLLYVSPDVNPEKGTAVIRASLPEGSSVRPGQLVTLRIVTLESRDCLAVPVDAVFRGDGGTPVVALVEGDRARQTPVTTGLRDGGLVEVEADGLRDGAVVVVEGAYGLPPETRIRVLGE